MIVRQIDVNHDWTFGQGKNNFITTNPAIVQDINTRLLEFLGNCFFNLAAGIDWFSLLGGKNQTALNLAVSAVILNTQNVTGLLQLSVTLSTARNLTIAYRVQTTYSVFTATFQYDLNGIG